MLGSAPTLCKGSTHPSTRLSTARAVRATSRCAASNAQNASSASRQIRWSSPSRTGSTLILQFRNIVDGGTAFSRLRQTYAACTPTQFAKPDKTTVTYKYLKKPKQIRLVWALYTTTAKTEIQRAEALAIKRAGGALIITRSIVKDVPDTTSLKTSVNQKLTGRQFAKYKAAAFS